MQNFADFSVLDWNCDTIKYCESFCDITKSDVTSITFNFNVNVKISTISRSHSNHLIKLVQFTDSETRFQNSACSFNQSDQNTGVSKFKTSTHHQS